jgi:hypothetical protein
MGCVRTLGVSVLRCVPDRGDRGGRTSDRAAFSY